MYSKKILVVDDEVHILELLSYNLKKYGYEVVTVKTGEQAFNVLMKEKIDLIILDLMLPGMDGIEVCKKLKASDVTALIPIIMLTARSEEFDKVVGLEIGADDYITKPFSIRELIVRVKALLRRIELYDDNDSKNVDVFKFGDIHIDLANYEVYKDNIKLDLTLKEFELLRLLVLNKNKVLTRNQLLDKIWGYDYYGETRTVDVHIRYIRKKIDDEGKVPQFIQTIRGVGYKFNYKEEQ